MHLSVDILKEAVQPCVLQDCCEVAFTPEINSASWVSLYRWTRKIISLSSIDSCNQEEICQDTEAVLPVCEGHKRFLPFLRKIIR